MTDNQKIIIYAAAGFSVIGTIALIIYMIYNTKNNINFTAMKQSIQALTGNNFFSDSELIASATAKKKGIDNTPDENAWKNLHALRDNVLNPARKAYGSAVYVNCAYRCPELNTLVGGASTSQHLTGCAADITTRSKKGNQKLFAILMEMNNFDQLIWEGQGSWIHVSYDPSRDRQSVLAQNANGNGYTNIKNNWQEAIA